MTNVSWASPAFGQREIGYRKIHVHICRDFARDCGGVLDRTASIQNMDFPDKTWVLHPALVLISIGSNKTEPGRNHDFQHDKCCNQTHLEREVPYMIVIITHSTP